MIDIRTSTSRPWTRMLMRPSCGKPLLGNIQAGHDLQPRHDGVRELMNLGRQRLDTQHPVDAEPDTDGALGRFDVDVARPLLKGFDQQLVHQLDDRRSLSRLGQLAEFIGDLVEEFDPLFLALGHELVDRVAAHPQRLLDQLDDLVAAGQHRIDATAAQR